MNRRYELDEKQKFAISVLESHHKHNCRRTKQSMKSELASQKENILNQQLFEVTTQGTGMCTLALWHCKSCHEKVDITNYDNW